MMRHPRLTLFFDKVYYYILPEVSGRIVKTETTSTRKNLMQQFRLQSIRKHLWKLANCKLKLLKFT